MTEQQVWGDKFVPGILITFWGGGGMHFLKIQIVPGLRQNMKSMSISISSIWSPDLGGVYNIVTFSRGGTSGMQQF